MSKAVLSFTATQTDPYDLQRLFLKPSPKLLYSKIAVFYKTEEKQVLLMIIFHRVMGCKSDIFGFGTSNMISRKDIMPVLASFKNLDNFSLSATLTHNGSSVPWLKALLNKSCNIYSVTLTFHEISSPQWCNRSF